MDSNKPVENRVSEAHAASVAYEAKRVAIVTGATSQIAHFLIPKLVTHGYRVYAVSRKPMSAHYGEDVHWLQGDIEQTPALISQAHSASVMFHLAPLPLVIPLVSAFRRMGGERIIAFSSTSIFSKNHSADPKEKRFVECLIDAEHSLGKQCEQLQVAWTLFRPTLIYGAGKDKNIMVINRFLSRCGVFPIVGKGQGLRRPVHAEDLADACLAVIHRPNTFAKSYNLSGASVITYRQMVETIFQALGKKPRFLTLPLPIVRFALMTIRWLPGFHYIGPEMANRMAIDLDFDYDEASADFGFAPRAFSVNSMGLFGSSLKNMALKADNKISSCN